MKTSERVAKYMHESINDWYGVRLTYEQFKARLEADAELDEDVASMGYDTSNREGFISKLSKDLTGTHWPCGIDGMAYQLAWAPKFAEGAAKAGYALDDGWLSRFTEA